MTHISITRGFYGKKQILGQLQVITNDKVVFACHSLELPFKDNQKRISSIPCGIYPAVKFNSPHNGNCILLNNVLNRSYIEIHKGNFNSDILGCIIVGKYLSDINADGYLDVIRSTETMKKILSFLPEKFNVSIK